MKVTDLVAGVCDGAPTAVARAISAVERGRPEAETLLGQVYPRSGNAHVVGVTGIPGSGKSTLVTRLAEELRTRGRSVAIVAVDPSSPYSGGSLLGDRIRMGSLAEDAGVFIRSMATHGTLGGLARATSDTVIILDAAGWDVILIETVGVGQDEVEIATASHTTVVLSVPGTGDDIQAIKAGILEVADVHVVNKADRDGADRLMAQLKDMLRVAGFRGDSDAWRVPVQSTVAEKGRGIAELLDAIDEHAAWLQTSGHLQERERLMAEARIRGIVHQLVRQRVDREIAEGIAAGVIGDVSERTLSPIKAARTLLEHVTGKEATAGGVERSRS